MSDAENINSTGERVPAEIAALTGPRLFMAFKGVFSGEYTGARGACLIIADVKAIKADRLYVIISGEGDEFKYQTTQDWKSFESSLISTKLQGSIAHQTTIDVQAYMKKVLQDDLLLSLIEAAWHSQVNDVRRIVADIISRAIADSQVLLQIEVETFEESGGTGAVLMQDQGASVSEQQKASATDQQAQTTARLKVDPILSPVQGVAAKNLLPGMVLSVEVRDPSTIKQNVAKLLTLKPGIGGKNNILDARVVSIHPAEYDRVTILSQLGQNIQGISVISGELRVKVSETAKKFYEVFTEKPSTPPGPVLSSMAFFWSAILIIGIMLILAYLVFGGIISG